MRTLDIFSANLKFLMNQPGNPASALAVERAAQQLGRAIGRTSIGRYATAGGNPTLDHVETLAKVFSVDAWRLLHPRLGTLHAES